VVGEILEALIDPEQTLELGVVGIAQDDVMVLTDDSLPWNNSLLHLNLTVDVGNLCEGCSLSVCFLNGRQQDVCLGYDHGRDRSLFLDRERSGRNDFNPNFSRRLSAVRELPVGVPPGSLHIQAFLDLVAVEVFFDGGMTPMSALFYPDEPFTFVEIRHHALGNINSRLSVQAGSVLQGMKSIYDV